MRVRGEGKSREGGVKEEGHRRVRDEGVCMG